MIEEFREIPTNNAEQFSGKQIKNFLKQVFSENSDFSKYRKNNFPGFEIKSKSMGFLDKINKGEDFVADIVSFDKDGFLTVNIFADETEKSKGDKKKTVVRISEEIINEIK